MKKYFCLQLKLAARLLPAVLAVTLALLVGLGIILGGLLASFSSSEEAKRFTVALSGDTEDEYLRWGLAAVQSIDEERFSLEIVEMDQDEAHAALEKGQISAYVVIPEGFMEKALTGEIDPITYVTSAGVESVATLMKKEVTSLVTEMVVYSQKGAYGLLDVLQENDLGKDAYSHMTALSLEYTDLILHRDEVYKVTELGVSDGLGTRDYYICAVLVILMVLTGIPFAALYIKRDHALCRMLHSRGCSYGKQLLCEYGVHLLSLAALVGAVLLIAGVVLAVLPASVTVDLPDLGGLLLRLIPVLMMVAAFDMMLFHLSGNLVSGLLLHFFAAIGLCYVSGCIYPASAFPKAIQQVAQLLPTGIARQHIATGFTLTPAFGSFLGLIAYTAAFFGVALLLRRHKTAGIER